MEPEPEPVDLSVLDPKRDGARFDGAVARVAARGLELRRFRRLVARRGVTAAVLVAAAAVALWLSAPRQPHADEARSIAVLGWAVGASPDQVLNLGGSYAQ
jgi:hypothetical protein